jgi:hypothetical protein
MDSMSRDMDFSSRDMLTSERDMELCEFVIMGVEPLDCSGSS